MSGKIEIGAHMLSWGTNLPQEIMFQRAEQVKKLGCGAFEVFLSGNLGPASAIKEAVKKFGLTPIGCAVIRNGIDGDPLSTDEETRLKAEGAIAQYIYQIRNIGGSLLVGPLANILCKPNAHYPTVEESLAGISTFRSIVKVASSNRVKVAIEPLQWVEMPYPTWVQQVLDFIWTVEGGDGVPTGVLGILFDVYHALRMEENWLKALKKVLTAGRLFHVHVAGPNRTPPRIGQHISWTKLISALRNTGWNGTITIESFGEECDLPFVVTGPGKRLPAEQVIATGVATLQKAGLREGY